MGPEIQRMALRKVQASDKKRNTFFRLEVSEPTPNLLVSHHKQEASNRHIQPTIESATQADKLWFPSAQPAV